MDLLAKTQLVTDEVLAPFHRAADLEQGLIDRRDNDAFIKLGVKGWLAEDAERPAAPTDPPSR